MGAWSVRCVAWSLVGALIATGIMALGEPLSARSFGAWALFWFTINVSAMAATGQGDDKLRCWLRRRLG